MVKIARHLFLSHLSGKENQFVLFSRTTDWSNPTIHCPETWLHFCCGSSQECYWSDRYSPHVRRQVQSCLPWNHARNSSVRFGGWRRYSSICCAYKFSSNGSENIESFKVYILCLTEAWIRLKKALALHDINCIWCNFHFSLFAGALWFPRG